MKFSNYFEAWLYGENGYYSNYKTIGKEGDFFTAVSTSAFFGGTIGKRAVDVINEGYLPKDTTIVEIGAHHGYLLADMIQFIYTLQPELLKTLKFAIVERFPHLQQKQKEYFENSFGNEIELRHFDNINQIKLDNAFVVANEIFDAFKCELVYTTTKDKAQKSRKIAEVKDNKISFVECKNEYINKICDKYKITKGEIGIGYEEFAKILSDNIKKYEFITFDYGEKYPRNDFSARIYHKHNVYPLFQEDLKLNELFGNSDITYDVNFAHVIDSFNEAGAKNIFYQTQLKSLVEFGILDLLQMVRDNASEKDYLREVQKAKTLLEPIGMGERFKMAVFRKG